MAAPHLQEVLDVLAQAVVRVDPLLRVTWVDPSFARKTGLNLEKGQILLDALERGPAREQLCAALGARQPYTGTVITCALKQMRLTATPIREGALVVLEAGGLDEDAAFARALQEIARAVSESLELETVCAAAVVAMVRFAQVSRAEVYLVDEQHGLKRLATSDVTGTSPAELRPDLVLKHALATGQPQIGIDQGPDKQGSIFAALPLNAHSGRLGLLVLHKQQGESFSTRELDLWSAAAGQLAVAVDNARLLREAQAALKVREEFMSIASHELKTPLTPLKMCFYSMEKRLSQGLAIDLPTVIKGKRQVDRLTGLVVNLLDVSRLQLGKLSLETAPLDAGQLMAEVVDHFQLAYAERTFVLTPPEKRIWVNGDRDRLEQVLVNVVENALKYSPPDKPVEVGLTRTRDEVRLQIRDHGIGIPGADQGQVFQRFYRARNASYRHFSGLGLGLFISDQIARLHGGVLELRSAEGHGTLVSLVLPRLSSSALRRMPRRVLVLETPQKEREICELLRTEGYEALPVHNISDALSKLAQTPVDLVMISAQRPASEGELFTNTIRDAQVAAHVPMLFTGEELPAWAGAEAALCSYREAPNRLAETVKRLTSRPRPVSRLLQTGEEPTIS